MADAADANERAVLEKFRKLSPKKKQEALDFLEFLAAREKAKAWIEFDTWARNLAKEKGFAHLTEEDIARIVSDLRGAQ
jgi:hypothetical protein